MPCRPAPLLAGRGHGLHELFEAQADLRPGALAVVHAGSRTTYGELERDANRLARRLRACGVKRGSVVAMQLPRSADAYAALLGILKSGAAYVPVDPDCPAERTRYILEDCGAAAFVTTDRHAQPFAGTLIRMDADREAIAAESPERLAGFEVGIGPRDLCYIIYTSGSTGRPKGVMVEHRSATHLVRTEGRLFGMGPEDRVYQGFSLAFDASVEEIWLAFHAGATLIAATPEMVHAGPDLPRLLGDCGVTVFSCVPTLLSMLADDIPGLRLLILGGEACPESLVARWAKPGRRMVNTYGPTEGTVIATCTELRIGKPVTIGIPIPGYRVRLLDGQLRPVAPGEVGEICIGGMGVARGYVGLPELTRERFVPDPFAAGDPADARLYRTGDLGRLDPEGNIEFHGRADAQVKLRGFRVELAEIESHLFQAEQVRSAACAVRELAPGVPQLVAWVVPRNGAVDTDALRERLRGVLPAYMVPALITTVRELPTLPSGKLDRGALPALAAPAAREAPARPERTMTGVEREILFVWSSLFQPLAVSLDHDFFLDLGGHSLMAARVVSELRKRPRFARLSVADIYRHRTITALAAFVEAQPSPAGPTATALRVAVAPAAGRGRRAAAAVRADERRRHIIAGVLQSLGLYVVFGLEALQGLMPYLVFYFLLAAGQSVLASVLWAAAAATATIPLLVAVAVAAKWLLLGRIRPGRHRLWGGYYVRWWFVRALIASLPLDYFAGTPLMAVLYRLLGTRIGRDVYLGTHELAAFDLTSIGDGSSVDDGASLLGYTVQGGELIIAPVTVGRRCFVGSRSVLAPGTVMEDGARLEDLSLVSSGGRIPSGETWTGSPARRSTAAEPSLPPRPAPGRLRAAGLVALYSLLIVFLPFVPLVAIVPGLVLLTRIDLFAHPWLFLAAAPLVGGSFVLLLAAEVVAIKWLVVGRVRPGTYPVHGGFYVRYWVVDQLMGMSLHVVAPLYATLYVSPWYRALGARIGRLVELSTASTTSPDLLEIADGGTIADEASVGEPRIDGGWMTLAPARVGRRAFVGNSGVVPMGMPLGDGSLVGVLSIAPSNAAETARQGTWWMGSPPVELPRREPSAGYREDRTYEPPRWLRLARGTFEILRVTLPPAGFILVTATLVTATLTFGPALGLAATLALVPLAYGACCAIVALAVVAAKWLVVGRYRPFVRPLWGHFIWRLELINALYEFLVTPLLLDALLGTPLLPWYFRLLGARIGRRVYTHTTGLLEWDLADIGDRVELNDDCVMQSHLFEDRVLKASRFRIGNDCTVGALSVVLYDSVMEDGSTLDALSLLMKGERLQAGTAWSGIPAS